MSRHVLPRGATPYVVSVDDLDAALRFALQANEKYVAADVVAGDPDAAALHFQTYGLAVCQYKQLKADAESEVLAAHQRHRSQIAA